MADTERHMPAVAQCIVGCGRYVTGVQRPRTVDIRQLTLLPPISNERKPEIRQM